MKINFVVFLSFSFKSKMLFNCGTLFLYQIHLINENFIHCMSYNIEIKFYRIKNSLRQKMKVCVEIRKLNECKFGNHYNLIYSFILFFIT